MGGNNPTGHNASAGWGLGGAALHHYGTWPRITEETFHLKSLHGLGLDWPIGYEDLRGHYDRIQAEVGIAGDAEAEIWRPPGEPYPMPPLNTFRHGKLLRRGFEARGLHTAPLPLAITSVPYNGRPPCIYDGWCDAGCPTGALANPLVTYLKDAIEAGVDVTTESEVTRVLVDARGWARSVEYVESGQRKVQPAHLVVLAGAVFQNPRLLLNSASDRFPAGLANSSGLVGRYLFGEGAAPIYGLFNEETECHMGVNAGQLTHREAFASTIRRGIYGGLQWQIGGAVKPNDLFGIAVSRVDLFGQALHDFIRSGARHFAFMIGFCGGVSSPENRVELSKSRDANGMPLARAVHSMTAGTAAMRGYMERQGQEIVEASGAREVWTGPPLIGHVTGGTIMGADRTESVTDGFGICHDVPNLVLAGSGLFPASTGASPTFTLMAVASRSADHLLEHWGSFTA